MPRTYRQLRDALQRLDALPPGPAHDRAVHELRASLRALSAAEVARLFLDIQQTVLARRVQPASSSEQKAA